MAYGRLHVPPRLLAAAVVLAVLPDLDSVGLQLGIPYSHTFGHRGFSHSLSFALIAAVLCAACHRLLKTTATAAFSVGLLACASHGFLDALTTGGLGIAFFSPISNERYFFPWRPIAVSPLSIERFFSEWGVRVLRSEFLWVWVPCLSLGFLGYLIRRKPRGV